MLIKLKLGRWRSELAKLEQSQPAQDLQYLSALLQTLPDQTELTEVRLRNFAQSFSTLAQPGQTNKPTVASSAVSNPKVIPVPFVRKQPRLARRLLLTSLALIIIMTTGLLVAVYLYTPPVSTPSVVTNTTATVANQQPYNDCLKQYSNPVDCLVYNESDGLSAWVNLSQSLNLIQSANGYTMTLRRAYADTNNLIIGYELKGNNVDQLGTAVRIRLRLPDQAELVSTSGNSVGVTVATDRKGLLERINLADLNLKEKPSPLQLRLEVPFIQVQSTRGQGGPGDFSNVALNFSFDLSIPFYSGQELQLNQVTNGATLQKVVITPSEVRVYLDGVGEVPPDAFFSVNTHSASYHGNVIYYLDRKAVIGFLVESSQDGTPQKWTLKVNPGVVQDWNPVTRFKQMLTGGPWTFKFET